MGHLSRTQSQVGVVDVSEPTKAADAGAFFACGAAKQNFIEPGTDGTVDVQPHFVKHSVRPLRYQFTANQPRPWYMRLQG